MSVDVERLLADASAARLSGADRTASDELLIIDPETRQIAVPENFLLGVESDQNVERVRFQCPKIVGDNIDLSDLHIYVNYRNANQEVSSYWCQDVEVEGDNITFSWLVSRAATMYQGETIFIVCAKAVDDEGNLTNEWNTTIPEYGGIVLEGLEPDPRLEQQYPDVIEQILTELDTIKAGGGSGITSVEVDVENTTGTPSGTGSVEEGILKLSFSGLKGETGPQGPQGPKGDTGATPNIQIGDVTTLQPDQQATASITGTTENPILNLGIPKGANGSGGGDGTGITQRQINALNEMFKICAYTQNPSSQYNEFLQAFDIGGVEPSESWKITNNLTNVVNNNNAIYVIKGSPYSATLTASEGYSINSVIVEMGGEDVTSTVYSDGNINISSVTGDVVITATAEAAPSTGLPQDGLLGMFDFRNATDEQYNLTGWGNVYKLNSPENKTLLAFSVTQIQNSNKYGIETISNYKIRELRRIDDESKSLDLGQEFTISAMAYGDCVPSLLGWIRKGNIVDTVIIQAIYIDSLDANKTKSLGKVSYTKKSSYSNLSLVVNNDTAKIYADGNLLETVESSAIEDFKAFVSSPIDAEVSYPGEGHYLTAVAIYDRALSDIEIVEVAEYLKTLEANE